MKITAEPRSDQWNGDDFVGGPRIFTIAGVKPGKAEQKYDIDLAGEARVWRPPVTVIRLLIAAWGDESDAWVGRRVRLKFDPTVRFGPDEVGGIRIDALSHIGKPLKLASTVKRGKKAPVTIQPLPDAPAPTSTAVEDTVAQVIADLHAAPTMPALKTAWDALDKRLQANPDVIAAKETRKTELTPKEGQ